jgi:glutamate dehydrogenase
MTGGPDGDLGSNEILLANEAIVAVVDGSGVLHDPAGLDKAELQRLAGGRLAVAGFDRSKLGPQGYLVLVGDTDVRLPNGTLVASGLSFRNNYHLYADVTADFFVPCGGRPAAVNADNVDVFLYGTTATDGSVAAAATGSGAASGGAGALPTDAGAGAGGVRRPRFKWIVEGANLFFTNDARLKIEAAGVVLVKDSSANKGGVTSSSLEVLAALALTDAEFSAHMCIPAATRSPVTGGSSTPAPVVEAHGGHGLPDNLPAFYRRYVAEVQRIIEANAALEFECLWREHDRTGTPYTLLSDQLSSKITALSTKIEASDSLWGNTALRGLVLRDALPKTLTELVGGYDVVLGRLPENYLRALFGSRLASRFIYESGLATDEFSFYSYLDSLLKHGGAGAAVAGGSVAAAAGVGAKGGAGAALVAM